MALKSFKEWKKIHEGKMHVNRERKLSDVEQLQDDGSIKVNVGEAKPRIPVGRPASACGVGGNKNRYNRREAKRVNLD
jgi:hypothetical protein